MNLHQLVVFCEVVDQGLNLSAAAQRLRRSQPSITRQVQELEEELGAPLFLRKRSKILQLTPYGREVLTSARRIVRELHAIRGAGEDTSAAVQGDLTIATTHSQARYTLPLVIRRFAAAYPFVRLILRQGTPAQCVERVAQGTADVAICTETLGGLKDILSLPCYRLNRSVVVPRAHPLLKLKTLTLEAIARYPLITYDEGFSGRWFMEHAFSERNLEPRVVLRAIDADVCKAYVEIGLGIAILANIGFDKARDRELRCIDARHLFPSSTLRLMCRRHSYLRHYVLAFIGMFAPQLSGSVMERALTEDRMPPHVPVPELDRQRPTRG